MILLCDSCLEAREGGFAECEDDCSLPLDHDGVCGRRATGPDACDVCGTIGRLHEIDGEGTCDACEAAYDLSARLDEGDDNPLGLCIPCRERLSSDLP